MQLARWGSDWSVQRDCWPRVPAVPGGLGRGTGNQGPVESRRSRQRRRCARRSRAAEGRRARRSARRRGRSRCQQLVQAACGLARRRARHRPEGRSERRHRASRPHRRATDDHESSDRRSDLLRAAGAAVGVRTPAAGARNRTAQRERPEHCGHRCPVQRRERGSSVLSHDRAVLAAQQRPAVLQALRPERSRACRSGGDDERPGRESEVHRARRARRDESRDLRSRGALRSGQRGSDAALGWLESQASLVVRRRQRHAVQAVPPNSTWQHRLRARSRLSRRGQRAHRPAAQLEPCRRGRDRDDGQRARHRALRRDQVHDRHRLLRRLDHATAARVALSGPARRHPALVHVSGFVLHGHGGRRLRAARQLLRVAANSRR